MTLPDTETADPKESTQDRNWRELEDERDALKAKVVDLTQELTVNAFERAGFEVKRSEDGSVSGVGALLADTYAEDDRTAAALKAYAEGRGIVPVAVDAAKEPETKVTEPTPEEKAAPEIEAAQDRMQIAQDFGSHLPAPDDMSELQERVEAAQQKGGPTSQQEVQDALDLHRQLDPTMPR